MLSVAVSLLVGGLERRFSRCKGSEALVFSTARAELFLDLGDPDHIAFGGTETELGGLVLSKSSANVEARQRFKKVIPGNTNVRTDCASIFSYPCAQQYCQWEAYGPISPIQ